VVVDLYFYRDPEAEEQKDEEKVPGAEETPAAAVGGFGENADWTGEPGATAPGIEGAAQADVNWTDTAGGEGDWAQEAAPAAAGASGW